MAHTNGRKELPDMVRRSLEQAQNRFQAIEVEAQKVVKNLVKRGQASRKELAKRLNAADIIDKGTVKEIRGRAQAVSHDLVKRMDELQDRILSLVGIASREQVNDLAREIDRLSRKVDKLLGKRGKDAEA